jgi:single-stranded DNA-binding protein
MTEAAVSFAGNLTDDPEIRSTEAGIARAMFRVAVSDRREQQEPSFFTVIVWRDQAEHVAEELGPSLRWATATTTRVTNSVGEERLGSSLSASADQ